MKDIDTELRVRLLSAKRKPHYFALICSGSKCIKLLLDKKRIPPGTAQSAKQEFKGQKIYSGTCQGTKAPIWCSR